MQYNSLPFVCVSDCLTGEEITGNLLEMQGNLGPSWAQLNCNVSAISTCCLALALCLDVQARVHEELDRIIGRNRLPTESDRGRLPYLEAIITEGLRWRPVAPSVCMASKFSAESLTTMVGLPHRLSVEDEYRGHRIPQDALIFVNVW
jgi:hypothetical protein